MDLGNVSRYIKELREKGLIKVEKRERAQGGKPYKFCVLPDRTRRILAPLLEETRLKAMEKGPPEWQINLFIEMLEDHNVTQDFRVFIASKLSDLAERNAASLVAHKKIRKLFEKIATDPVAPDNDEVGKHLMSCLSKSLPKILDDEKTKAWFFNKVYPSMFAKISDTKKEERIRQRAINNISRVTRLIDDSSLRNKTIDKFLEVYFGDANGLSNIVKDELAKFEQNFQKEVVEKVRSRLNKPEKKEKAEALLKELISLWLHTSSGNLQEAKNNAQASASE